MTRFTLSSQPNELPSTDAEPAQRLGWVTHEYKLVQKGQRVKEGDLLISQLTILME